MPAFFIVCICLSASFCGQSSKLKLPMAVFSSAWPTRAVAIAWYLSKGLSVLVAAWQGLACHIQELILHALISNNCFSNNCCCLLLRYMLMWQITPHFSYAAGSAVAVRGFVDAHKTDLISKAHGTTQPPLTAGQLNGLRTKWNRSSVQPGTAHDIAKKLPVNAWPVCKCVNDSFKCLKLFHSW